MYYGPGSGKVLPAIGERQAPQLMWMGDERHQLFALFLLGGSHDQFYLRCPCMSVILVLDVDEHWEPLPVSQRWQASALAAATYYGSEEVKIVVARFHAPPIRTVFSNTAAGKPEQG
jgi:hypothetical protein